MKNPSTVGRIFYGIAIAIMGFLTIYYHDFPYMLLPPKHSWIPGFALLAYIFGALLMLAGLCIVFQKQISTVSLMLGAVLLAIFCFYFIPYQLLVSKNNLQFGDWENAAKELALACGAFVIASCFSEETKNPFIRFLNRLVPFMAIVFSITIISFGVDHFLYAKEVADYVPSWVPFHLFWAYFAGAALLGSGFVIIFKIKPRLAAVLLGIMTFSWFIILHIPRIIASPAAYVGSEIASACLALAYSGIAFVIAGTDNEERPSPNSAVKF